jgi:DNA-binding response OmpR family regulator
VPETHLLVVDDEPHVARVIQHACESDGYRVSATRSLRGARTILGSEIDIDLILLDLTLPDGSGLASLRELLQAEHTQDILVVILSGAGRDDVRSKAGDLGAKYVAKPFSPSKLEPLVAEIPGETGAP